MAIRGRAEPNLNNPTQYIYSVISLKHVFVMNACPGHIMESTKEIEMKLGL